MKKMLVILCVCSLTSMLAQRNRDQITTGLFGSHEDVTILTVHFEKGKAHNHPLMVFWLADSTGSFIQTLYVAESIGKGCFQRVDRSKGMWQAGAIQRPATLPYWAHQRGIKNEFGTYLPSPKHPVPDAFTGATPAGSFRYHLLTNEKLSGRYSVYMEINQSWDWNAHWHNNKYPDDKEYKTSSQPAVVFKADIDTFNPNKLVDFEAIGHSHYAGKDGTLYPALHTLTTALEIVKKCTVKVQ